MNLDTNIALGVRPPPIDFNAMNQGNVLAQLAQLKNADNQNALAQYQLATAKRSDASQEALMRDAQDPNFKMTFSNAIKYGPLGMTALKAQLDAETKAAWATYRQALRDMTDQHDWAAMKSPEEISWPVMPHKFSKDDPAKWLKLS
jgi:hypothetical protein